MFRDATAFQAKYTCASSSNYYVKPSECTTIRSDWIAPPPPPASPLPPQLQWHLAESSSDDCDIVCAAHGKVCNADALQFDYVALSGNYVDLFAAASSAGISCNNGGGTGSISAPIYHNDNCYQYDPPSNQVCSGSGGYGLRICPCV